MSSNVDEKKPAAKAEAAEAKPVAKAAEAKPAAKPSAKKVPEKKQAAKAAAKEPAKAAAKPAAKPSEAKAHQKVGTDEVVVKFDHVTKTYNLYKNDRGRFLNIFGIKKEGQFLGSINANDDLSFEIHRGEGVAFLGLNGAGKSTALKMVTGVAHPTKGEVTVRGRVSALLELTAGFDGQLTGRENIALRGQILGMKKDEIAALEPGVIDFADLGVYIDQPMKTYSSGMRARLGFGFAVAINPEILVVDEALSVGDRAFRKKCTERINEIMMDESVTVLFVTHASATAKEFCSRGIVLDKGRLVFDGDIGEATAYYEKNY